MRRMFTVAASVVLVGALSGCITLGRMRSSSPSRASSASSKDCAACEKMCAVAGNAEDNPDAVSACKADCRKSCR